MQIAIWNALGSSRRLTPGILTDTVTEVLERGVRNGGILPGGELNPATKADVVTTTGNQEFNGVLAAGYLSVGVAQCPA